MEALVWVSAWQMQCCGEPFAVGQQVSWPMSSRLNATALTQLVGGDTAARVWMAFDLHAQQPEETASHSGIVRGIEGYRCRHVQGNVVPGSVEVHPVDTADGWEAEEDSVDFVGYLVTLDLTQPAETGDP